MMDEAAEEEHDAEALHSECMHLWEEKYNLQAQLDKIGK